MVDLRRSFRPVFPLRLGGLSGEAGLKSSRFGAAEIGASLSFNPQIKLIFLLFHGFRPHECCLETCASSLDERLLSWNATFWSFFCLKSREQSAPLLFLAVDTNLAYRACLASLAPKMTIMIIYQAYYDTIITMVCTCGDVSFVSRPLVFLCRYISSLLAVTS